MEESNCKTQRIQKIINKEIWWFKESKTHNSYCKSAWQKGAELDKSRLLIQAIQFLLVKEVDKTLEKIRAWFLSVCQVFCKEESYLKAQVW